MSYRGQLTRLRAFGFTLSFVRKPLEGFELS